MTPNPIALEGNMFELNYGFVMCVAPFLVTFPVAALWVAISEALKVM